MEQGSKQGVMECFYRSKLFDEKGKRIRGCKKKMFREWGERGMLESTEQRVCVQARAIRKNGWLSRLESEAIKRQVKDESRMNFVESKMKQWTQKQ